MEKGTKIAIVNSVYKYGSTGRICFELAQFLNNNRFVAKVYYGRGKKARDGIGVKFSSTISVLVHNFFARIFDSDSRHSYFATKRLIKALKQFKPSLIILHNLHGYYINLRMIVDFINKNNVPTFFVLHDCWSFTGHCAYFSFLDCKKYKKQCYKCANKRQYPKSVFLDNSKNNYLRKKILFTSITDLTIICPSKWLANLTKESFFSNRPVHVINNGINTEIFRRNKIENKKITPLFSNNKIILFVSNIWDERKGLNDVINLSKIISNNEKIVVVGKIKGKKVKNKSIVYIERTSSLDELVYYYSRADVFVNFTYEDNYPTVNLEALACNLPVVCYKTGGSTEPIDENFAIKQGDYKKAYELIEKILYSKEKYHFKSRDLLDKKQTYNAYLNLIANKLLEEKND